MKKLILLLTSLSLTTNIYARDTVEYTKVIGCTRTIQYLPSTTTVVETDSHSVGGAVVGGAAGYGVSRLFRMRRLGRIASTLGGAYLGNKYAKKKTQVVTESSEQKVVYIIKLANGTQFDSDTEFQIGKKIKMVNGVRQ